MAVLTEKQFIQVIFGQLMICGVHHRFWLEGCGSQNLHQHSSRQCVAGKGLSVCVVDADRSRSALAFAIRGKLPFPVVPVEAAAKATRSADVVITDGQASSDEEELRHLAVGSDLVLLPTSSKGQGRGADRGTDQAAADREGPQYGFVGEGGSVSSAQPMKPKPHCRPLACR